MESFTLASIALVGLISFAAGFVDAVVGGGGLLTTPALLILFPEMAIAQVLGTTKAASLVGTSAAAVSYARRLSLPMRQLAPACLASAAAAYLGARAVSHLPASVLRPAILVLLIVMAVYTALKPDLGQIATRTKIKPSYLGMTVTALILGFYDGFFGPGTGSILVLLLIVAFGFDFLTASGTAKFINGASNVGALIWFLPAGAVVWPLAIPMALCNMLGGIAGSHFALKAGNAWIRRAFLVVVIALIARLGYAMFTN
jgi:uncharacterized protein